MIARIYAPDKAQEKRLQHSEKLNDDRRAVFGTRFGKIYQLSSTFAPPYQRVWTILKY